MATESLSPKAAAEYVKAPRAGKGASLFVRAQGEPPGKKRRTEAAQSTGTGVLIFT